MDTENKIRIIAGKRVNEVLDDGRDEPCAECCLYGECCVADIPFCDGRNIHFVPAEEDEKGFCKDNCKGFQETGRCFADGECDAKKAREIEGPPQEVTLIPSNEDADKAATDYYLNLPNSSYGEGGYLLPRSINDAFKAGAEWQAMKDGECHEESFEEGAKWQRERLASCPTIKGWVARDMFGDLNVFIKKPTKFFGKVWSDQTGKRFGLSESLFPDLKWEDEPKKVSVTIKAE